MLGVNSMYWWIVGLAVVVPVFAALMKTRFWLSGALLAMLYGVAGLMPGNPQDPYQLPAVGLAAILITAATLWVAVKIVINALRREYR